MTRYRRSHFLKAMVERGDLIEKRSQRRAANDLVLRPEAEDQSDSSRW